VSDYPRELKGQEILRNVAARALSDADYKRDLINNPNEVLSSEGLDIPDGVNVVIHENTEDTIHLSLPADLPDIGELDIEIVDITIVVATHF
jgi:hypothetical protein